MVDENENVNVNVNVNGITNCHKKTP